MNSKETITYQKLEAFIKSVFKRLPAKYTLTYKDSDEDMICLLNDVDMKILFESGMNKVRIEIQECSEDFYDHTQEIVIEQEPVKNAEEKEVVPKVEVQEPVPEVQEEAPSFVSEVKSIDDSISEKLSKMMPDIISKIKEQVMTESKIRSSSKTMEEIQPKIETNSQVVHAHVTCDECHASPIVGIRYKCVVCPNFDVCESCEAKSTHAHPFLKIRHLRQTPIKIFAVIDDQDESLEINGQKVPLPGLNESIQEGINLFTGLFGGQRRPEECRRAFGKCKENFKRFAHQFKEFHKNQCSEQKVEVPKAEPKVEQVKVEVPKVVEAPMPEVKKEEPSTQPVIVEDKKEQKKVEAKEEPKPKTKEDITIEAANYISEVMGQSFNKSYRFAANYPGLTKEEILMKFLEQ